MAEEAEDGGEKTEDPSQKRLNDALEKGDVAKSQEVNTWFIIAASLLVIAGFTPSMATGMMTSFAGIVEHSYSLPADNGGLRALWMKIGEMLLVPLVLPLTVLGIAGLLGNLIQHMPIFSAEPIMPKLSKISPIAGFGRLFSTQSLLNFGKGIVKIALVGIVLGAVIWPERDRLDLLVQTDLNQILPIVRELSIKLVGSTLIVFTVIAIVDFFYEKWRWTEKQKMTLKEVKDEYKAQEGNPEVKARIRQIRQQRSRKRMMAAVPQANVIITNPTHYSIALKYERGMNAPLLVAKGIDDLAFRIREIAKEHDIPLVENPPLARALYATVDIDQEVPAEHYRAVADVISYVMKLNARSSWRAKKPS
ncbi:MAG: flagellar biosynthesis protein FlhB [Rhizobiales bacterium]|nr:flagellar biosynthesis protein FlhB [Hyphomicrobiales bacterium]